jgi:proton-dependent oligopeptide transporter, POT family
MERAAFYGVYINLSVYLVEVAHLDAAQSGWLMGTFAALKSWLPLATGPLADRLGYRASLIASFSLYIAAYALFAAVPAVPTAFVGVFLMSLAGGFLKPVIPAAVKTLSPEGAESRGFSLFYASVNFGSVVGKVLTWGVRVMLSLRTSVVNAAVWSVLGLIVTFAAFRMPKTLPPNTSSPATVRSDAAKQAVATSESKTAAQDPPKEAKASFLHVARVLLTSPRYWVVLLVFSAFYLMNEQFYQTFPLHIALVYGKSAPRELLSLMNPITIALFQVPVAAAAQKLSPRTGLLSGLVLGALSMLVMALVPSMFGIGLSFFVFAFAEMIAAPRFYSYALAFAPKGGEASTMSFSLLWVGLGGLVGGALSGKLIKLCYKTAIAEGGRSPAFAWMVYASVGAASALAMALVIALFRDQPEKAKPTT